MELLEVRGRDFCCFGEVKLPLKNMGLIWIGGENKDTKAADNNGSGKSTIFKLLTWTLFGQTVDGEKGDKVIRHGAKAATGEVDLGDGDDVWTVRRTRKKGSPGLLLIQPDGNEFKAGKDELQDRIIEMAGGLDFLAFKNTVLYGQNDVFKFTHPKTKDTDRKDMLHKILRTGLLKHCHKWATDKRLDAKREAAEKKAEVEKLEARLEEVDLDGIRERRREFDAETAGLVEEQTNAAKLYRDKAEGKTKAAGAIKGPPPGEREKLSKKANELAHQQLKLLAALEKTGGEIDALEAAEAKYDSVKDEVSVIRSEVKQLTKELKRLSGSKCSLCKSSLKQGKAKRYIDKTQVKLKAAQESTVILEEKATAAGAEVGAVKLELDRVRNMRAELSHVKLHISNINNQILDWDNQYHRVDAERREAEAEAAGLIKRAQGAEGRAEELKGRKNPFRAVLKEVKQKAKKYRKAAKALEAELKELGSTLAHIEFWVRGFSNQGLPSFIMDSVMPFITERANHYLETLTDGDITMEFTTQREMKSSKGEFRDEIDISWQIEGVEGSYPPSGGQMKKMEIATDFALMDLVAAREGGGVDLLALDEVLDGLDAEGRQRVMMLLREIRAKRGSVFVISHDPDVAEVFEKAIIVTKKGGKSALRVAS